MMAADPTELKEEEKREEIAIAPSKDDDADFSDLGSKGPVHSNEASKEPSHLSPKKEASLAQNYEERAKEQRIEKFIELRKYLDSKHKPPNISKIENELDLIIVEKEIQYLRNKIEALKQSSESEDVKQQIQEQRALICAILKEKSSKLNKRSICLDFLYRTPPHTPEQDPWIREQQINGWTQSSTITKLVGVSNPHDEDETICTPERRKQELEEILIKEKSLVLKINLRTLCAELLRTLNDSKSSKKQSISFSFSQKEKKSTSTQKQAFETIKEVARSIKESEWVELQANVEDYIARLQQAIQLLDQRYSMGIHLDIVTKAKELRLELLKLKNPEDDIKGEKESLKKEAEEANETSKSTISSSSNFPAKKEIAATVSMEKEEAKIEAEKLSPQELCDSLFANIATFKKLSRFASLDQPVQEALTQIQSIASQFSGIFKKMHAPSEMKTGLSEMELRQFITQLKGAISLIHGYKIKKEIADPAMDLQFDLLNLYARQEFKINLRLLGDSFFIQTILDHIIAIRNARDGTLVHSKVDERPAVFGDILRQHGMSSNTIEKTIDHLIANLKEKHPLETELANTLETLKKDVQPWIVRPKNEKISCSSKSTAVSPTPENSFSSTTVSSSSSFSPVINRGDPLYSDSNNKGPSVLPEVEKRDIPSSSLSASIVFQAAIAFGTALLTSDATPYKIARGVIITTLVLGLAVGITAATCGIVPAALAIAGAIAAHAAIAESVAEGLLALGALGVAGFFGKECHKKRGEDSPEPLSNSKCN